MKIQEKCKIINEIFDKDFHGDLDAHATSDNTWHKGIHIKLKEHKFHDLESLLIDSTLEQVFGKTGMFIVGMYKTKDGLTLYMHESDSFRYVDKDGTRWENTSYRAKCPACGETKSFDLMRYDPQDYRDSTCPKCGDTHNVQNMYDLGDKK